MTITNTVSKQSYLTTGATTVWPFSFPLDRDGDLTVILTAPDGAETLVPPAQYRVERSSGAPGGTVTLPLSGPALGTGQTVTLLRRLPVTQATSLVTGAAFYAEDLERALDRQTMIAQQQQEQLDRCIKMAVSDPTGLALTLPPLAQRAGKSLKFDGSGALVPTQFDPDTQQAAASASATAAAADRAGAEAAAVTATTARDTAVASASAAAAAAASIGQETVEAVTAHRTAALADRGKVFAVDAATGPVTITLPPIASVGEPFRLTVKKTDATANEVSVAVSGGDTLDGGTAALLLDRQGAGVRVDSDIDPSPDNWVSQAFGVAVGDATPVGAEMWIPSATVPAGWVAETGGLLSRAAYPGLWAFAQASGLLVSEATWTGTPAEQVKFSSGDGATTFRLPLRATDAAGRRAIMKAATLPMDPQTLDVAALAGQVSALQTTVAASFVIRAAVAAAGTSIDFAGIPSGVKRIVVSVADLSTNGASVPVLQLGTSGGMATAGYTGGVQFNAAYAAAGAGFPFIAPAAHAASGVYTGTITLTLLDPSANIWVGTGVVAQTNTATALSISAASKTLSGVLTSLRITSTSGADAFDSGKINILYEGAS